MPKSLTMAIVHLRKLRKLGHMHCRDKAQAQTNHKKQTTRAAIKSKHQDRHTHAKQRHTRNFPIKPSNSVSDKHALGQRIVQFPQVKGKTTEKVEFFTTGEYHSITIDFEDKTSLNFEIEPGFTINAELQQRRKGETEVLFEWPPIPSET